MRRFVLPDEDAWGLPQDWWHGLHPRRGGRRPPEPEVTIDLQKIMTGRERILGRLVDWDQTLLAAGERHLRTPDDDPIAAAVAALTTGNRGGEAAALLVGRWVDRAGLPFAVRAAGEMFRLIESGALWTVPAQEGETFERLWRGDDFQRAVAVTRTLRRRLAAASGEEYAEAAGILAGLRTGPCGRILASYLMPDRVDWVDEDCAEAAAWRTTGRAEWEWADHRHLSGLLLLAASRTEHLERLRGTITDAVLGFRDLGVVATILDGVGPAAAPLLADQFYLRLFWLQDDRPENREGLGPLAIRFMSAAPDDDAARVVLRDTLDGKRSMPGRLLKSGMLTRYPIRSLRLLAERDDAVSRDLFGGLVLSEPRLIPHLPEPVRARAEAVVASGGAGVGAGWAALLDSNDWRRPIDSADDVKRSVAALAAIPTEEAFGLVLDRVEQKYFRQALLAAAKRDPGVAIRVLAARDTDPAVAELLRDHVLAYPQSVDALDEPGRARVHAIAGPPAAAGTGLPAILAAPARASALPEWLIPAKLPAITLRADGEALSPEAVRRLCQLLASSKIGAPRPEVIEVRALCDASELAAFAWSIFEQWQIAGHPPKSNLAMVSLAALGDDTTVPALTGLFPGWATAAGRVRTGLDVLAAIGTDLALLHLSRLSRRSRTAGFRRLAAERLTAVAEARGLLPEQLADRIVPSLGLDPDGRAVLDYGPRSFTVGLDEQLQPWIAGADGRRLARMPRPAAADDPELAPAAYRRFAEMRKEAKEVAGERLRAVEDAMVTERCWTAAEFRELFVRHPLMWQLTHRLVWTARDPGGVAVTTFRVAEDRTFADVDDKEWTLGDDAIVAVAHPWHLGSGWAEVFSDYAIIQPFPQIGRELFRQGQTDLTALAGAPVDGRKLFVLSSRGWRFDDAHRTLLRDWPGGARSEIAYSPGYHWQEPDSPKELVEVRGLDGLGPIAYSEVVRDVHYLTGS
jgi:hypothetical protein